jgi:hypothetical protein
VITPKTSDASESSFDVSSLNFDSTNWMEPQQVVVSGVDDWVCDRDIQYTVTITADAGSDEKYLSFVESLSFVNEDDDVVGINVLVHSNITTESGDSASFTVTLTSQPVAAVVYTISTNDASEGQVTSSIVVLAPDNWHTPGVTVTVVGQPDKLADGDIPYFVSVSPVVSDDEDYKALLPVIVDIVNYDDPVNVVTIDTTPVTCTTTEAGGTCEIVLNVKGWYYGNPDFTSPRYQNGFEDLKVTLTSMAVTEGKLSVAPDAPQASVVVTFTEEGNATLTITGQDDFVVDGDTEYDIRISAVVVTGDQLENSIAAFQMTTAVAVVNTDDDVASLVVTSDCSETSETGDSCDISVALATQPIGTVTIVSITSNNGEGNITAGEVLAFDHTNWNKPSILTATGVDDNIVDGDIMYNVTMVASSTDVNYEGLANSVSLINLDNDLNSLVVMQNGAIIAGMATPVCETGIASNFAVSLPNMPQHDVTVSVRSSNVAEGVVEPEVLIFSAINWDMARTVTVTGQDDDVRDGDTEFAVSLTMNSTDIEFDGIEWSFRVMNIDDDVVRARPHDLTQVTCFVTEQGKSCAIDVSITAWPSSFGQLTVTAQSADESEGTIWPSTITFDADNWQKGQNITVTGMNDDVDDADIHFPVIFASELTLNSGRSKPTSPCQVAVVNQDDDIAGVEWEQFGNQTDEAGNITLSFTFRLTSEPVAPVFFGVSLSDTTEASITTDGLEFNATSWNDTRVVYVTGVDDFVQDYLQSYSAILGNSESDDGLYKGLRTQLNYTNTDDDKIGINFHQYNTVSNEGGDPVILVVTLNSEPTSAVVFTCSTTDATEGLANPSLFVLAPDNWMNGETITITGQADALADGNVQYSIGVSPIVSDDADYLALPSLTYELTNMDDPSNELLVAVSKANCETGEDGQECLVQLSMENWYEGSLAWDPLIDLGHTCNPRYRNAYEKLVIMVEATDPTEGTIYGDDGKYNRQAQKQWTFTAEACVPVPTGAPSVDNSTAVAEGEPTGAPTDAPTVEPTSTPANRCWSDGLNFTVYGEDDQVVDGSVTYAVTVTAVITLGDGNTHTLTENQMRSTIWTTNLDDDSAGLRVAGIDNGVPDENYICTKTSESGDECSFLLKLLSEPREDVYFYGESSNIAEGLIIRGDSLLFDKYNWDTGLYFTVRGVDDEMVDGPIQYFLTTRVESEDDAYDEIPLPFGGELGLDFRNHTLTNLDNDIDILLVKQDGEKLAGSATDVDETGTTSIFSVQLTKRPLTGSNVTLEIMNSNPEEVSISRTILNWTDETFDFSYDIILTGLDDYIVDGDQVVTITLNVTSDDPEYNGLIWDFRVVNKDDDALLQALGLSFGRRLQEEGQEKLIDEEEHRSLLEDAGVEDAVHVHDLDGEKHRRRRLAAVDEIPDCNTTESGGQCEMQYSIGGWLSSYEKMVVELTSSLPTEAGVFPSTHTFSAENYTESFNFTLTGLDDLVDDGDRAFTLSRKLTIHCKDSSPNCINIKGTQYSILELPEHLYGFTNIDDDTASIVLNVTNTTTTENGAAAFFTVRLTAEPRATGVNFQDDTTVNLAITSMDETEGLPHVSMLTFDATNWNTEQQVIVYGVDDFVDDRDIEYIVNVGPAMTADGAYAGQYKTVNLLNIDDDTYSLNVTVLNDTSTELEESARILVFLGSEPTSPCVLTVSSLDGSEAYVNPSIIVLSADNWDTGKLIIVTGKQDNVDDGDVHYRVEMQPIIGDDDYLNHPIISVDLLNKDDPINFLIITTNSTSCITREDGINCVVKIELNKWYTGKNPFERVEITAVSTDDTEGKLQIVDAVTDTVAAAPAVDAQFIFNEENWENGAFLTLVAQDDDMVDGDLDFEITLTAQIACEGRPMYSIHKNKMPTKISAKNVDDDSASLVVSSLEGGPLCDYTSESGASCDYLVQLSSKPESVVTVHINTTNNAEALITSAATLVFTPSNWWSPAQTFTVTGMEDSPPIFENVTAYDISMTVESDDPNYEVVNRSIPMSSWDNDILFVFQNGKILSGVATNTDETGAQTVFTVKLPFEPTHPVTVALNVSNMEEVSITHSELIFDSTNWGNDQAVIITGLDDNEADGDVLIRVELIATSEDLMFDAMFRRFGFYNLDDDTVRVNAGLAYDCETTEAGGQCAVDVTLDSWQHGDYDKLEVRVVNQGDRTENGHIIREGTVTSTTGPAWGDKLIFDISNWNQTAKLTIRGLDDRLDDGDRNYNIVLMPKIYYSHHGVGSKAIASLNLNVTNIDDDSSALVVTQLSDTTREDANYVCCEGWASYSVKLNSEPYSTVVLNLESLDITEGIVFGNKSLTFTTGEDGDWDTEQLVYIKGVDDFVVDYDTDQFNVKSNVSYNVTTLTSPDNEDPKYRMLEQSRRYQNIDDDQIGLLLESIGVMDENNITLTSENEIRCGTLPAPPLGKSCKTAILSLRLASQPKRTVLFTVTSDDVTEALTTPNIVAFSSSDWAMVQNITVTGMDDDYRDYDTFYNIIVSTLFTDDPDYGHVTFGMLQETLKFANMDETDDRMAGGCARGTYGHSQPYCKKCPAGRFSDTDWQVYELEDCKNCPYGTHAPSNPDGSIAEGATSESGGCVPCPAGKYNNKLAHPTCTACSNGTYCGIASVVPVHNWNVTNLNTTYDHQWRLVRASKLRYSYSYFDLMTFESKSVVTEDSAMILWFFAIFLAAIAIMFVTVGGGVFYGSKGLFNAVRSCDMFHQDHFVPSDDEYSDSDNEEEDDDDAKVTVPDATLSKFSALLAQEKEEEHVLEAAHRRHLQHEPHYQVATQQAQYPLPLKGEGYAVTPVDTPANIPRMANKKEGGPESAVPTLEVSGAGAAAANGTYIQNGESDGVPRFTNGSICILRFNFGDEYEESRYWYLSDLGPGGVAGDGDDTDYYRCESRNNVPPATGWVSDAAGTAPPPMLIIKSITAEEPLLDPPRLMSPHHLTADWDASVRKRVEEEKKQTLLAIEKEQHTKTEDEKLQRKQKFEQLKAEFQAIDMDDDGQITRKEHEALWKVKHLELNLEEEELRAYMNAQFEAMDTDGNHTIDFREFITSFGLEDMLESKTKDEEEQKHAEEDEEEHLSFMQKLLKLLGMGKKPDAKPKTEKEDQRTFTGGLTTIAYATISIGLFTALLFMVSNYNEFVTQALVPKEEAFERALRTDIMVEMRFIGFTGRCPDYRSEAQQNASNPTLQYQYESDTLQVMDTGFSSTGDEGVERKAKSGIVAFKPGGAQRKLTGMIDQVTGLPMVNLTGAERSTWAWCESIKPKEVEVEEVEEVPVEFDIAVINASNFTNFTNLTNITNVTNLTNETNTSATITTPAIMPDQGSVLVVKWVCLKCKVVAPARIKVVLNGVDMEQAVSVGAVQYYVHSAPVVPYENNSLLGVVKPIDDEEVFRGERPTSQEVILIPATFDNNLKIVQGQGFRVQYGDTTEGATANKEEFMEKDNEMSFEVKFTTGMTQLEIMIDPDINFLDAICDLGGLFGAVTAGIVLAMQLFEKQAHKNKAKIAKAKEKYRVWVNGWRRKFGLPTLREKIFTSDEEEPGEKHHNHHHNHHHHDGDDQNHASTKKATRALGRGGFGRKKGMSGMLQRQALKRAQESANKASAKKEHHHHHHHEHKDGGGDDSGRPEFYKH